MSGRLHGLAGLPLCNGFQTLVLRQFRLAAKDNTAFSSSITTVAERLPVIVHSVVLSIVHLVMTSKE